MNIPHAIFIALMALYFIITKGLIIASILMFVYVCIAFIIAVAMGNKTGNSAFLARLS